VNGNVKSVQKWHFPSPGIVALEQEEETAFSPQKAEKKRGQGGVRINVASGTLQLGVDSWRLSAAYFSADFR
jgi:hypothetical protein